MEILKGTFYKERIKIIREYTVREIKDNLTKILIYLKDDNPDVRYEMLERLVTYPDDKLFTINLLEDASFLILDRDVRVRLLFAKFLVRFGNLSNASKQRLFNKDDLGLFIYAVEDEDCVVKMHIIEAMRHFLVPDAITFLINMFTDDSVKVREIVSKVLRKSIESKMDERIQIKCSTSQRQFLIQCLEEDNAFIQKNILRVLADLHQTDVTLFFYLLNKQNLKENRKIKTLTRMIINNQVFFYDYLEKNVDYTFDNDKNLHDEHYLGDLIILRALRRTATGSKLILSSKVISDLKYLDFKLKKGNITKPNVSGLIKGESTVYLAERTVGVEKVKAVVTNILEENTTIADTIEILLENNKEETKRLKEVELNMLELFKLIYSLKINKNGMVRSTGVEFNSFVICGPSEVIRFEKRPILFELEIFYDNADQSGYFKDLYVVVSEKIQTGETTEETIEKDQPIARSAFFPIQSTVRVVLDEKVDYLACYVALKTETTVLRLSEIHPIKVMRTFEYREKIDQPFGSTAG